MEIAIIADDTKKELMAQFCIAYCGILSRHHLYATSITGKYIQEATGLDIEFMLSGSIGGAEQLASRISLNEIDLLFYFRDTSPDDPYIQNDMELLRMCDIRNVPVATNIATAEVLVMALESGALDWRNFVNPVSEYNRRAKGKG
ncbi:MAG: methylglyoxal synthase [Clostridia bacterium]|nr:methylglyoxal synthase [Clostridia bacterium]